MQLKIVAIALLLALIATGSVAAQEQISQEAVLAEIGRLSLAVKYLTERVQQLEKEKRELQLRLEKYEPRKPELGRPEPAKD